MISIIGAGPAGCYTAELLAKKGKQAHIYEEHRKVGEPVECSGILTSSILDVLGPKILNQDFVINKLRKVEVVFPNSKRLFFKMKKPDIVVDRTKFDCYLKDRAVDAGASLTTETRFAGISGRGILIEERGERKQKKTDVLIGADGAMSGVAKLLNKKKKSFYVGSQARVKGEFDPSTYTVYLGSVCPDFFAWVLPEDSRTARVALATRKSPSVLFNRFIKNLGTRPDQIISRQGGPIPTYDPKIRTQGRINNLPIYIVGDAAGMVKATTGGGIVPGLKAVEELAYSITNHADYEKRWRKRIGGSLHNHLRIRRIMNRFDDRDYNRLAELLSRKKVKEIINEARREDSLLFPIIKLLLAEPRLLGFVRYL